MRSIAWYVMWGALSFAAACDSDLPSGARVTKLRLLALQADPAFARPGETVQLQVMVADHEERPLQFALGTCTNPAGSTVEHCVDALDAEVEVVASDDGRFTVDVPADFLRNVPDAARPSALIGAVLVACPGEIESGETSGVPVVCRDPGGERLPITEFEVGVKRVFVRDRDRNDNPAIERIRWDGEPWPEDEVREARACANAETDDLEDCAENLRHRIDVETSEPESGVDENGTAFREQQVVQFYASHGVFERPVRIAGEAETAWAAQRGASDGVARLWFVVRDDRGGVGWAERRVRVR